MNSIKRSAITENLVNNQSCAKSFNLETFKILKICYTVLDLVKMEAICILNIKPTLLGKNILTKMLLCLLNAYFGVYMFVQLALK